MRKKLVPIKCLHEKHKFETAYHRKSDKMMDGYVEVTLKTCKNCNILISKEFKK
jgi:hypothetical protein